MLPSEAEALKELEIAGKLNPGPWTAHSINTGIAAKKIAEKIEGMDENKAYILGLLHDIGRRAGIVTIPVHIVEGYNYCLSKGWTEAARICMTHSYPRMSMDVEDGDSKELSLIRDYLSKAGDADDYDCLIQICDSLATHYGFVILEKRFVDVVRRYGIQKKYIEGWDKVFEIKEYFENKMGMSIYDVLPDIEKTTMMTVKPWKPFVKNDVYK